MRPSDQIIKNLSLLSLALEEGIIDLDQLESKILMNKQERKYLEQHTEKIWQGKTNKYWYTRLDGKLIKKSKKGDLEEAIVKYYEDQDERLKPTFGYCFHEWIESRKKYKELKTNSICRYEDSFRRYVKGTKFEKIKLADLNDLILDDYVRTTIAKHELTAKGFSSFRTIILGALKYAKRMHYTDFSPSAFFSDFQISKSAFRKPSDKKKYIYTKGERKALYEYLMSEPTIENLGLALMCLTGLRVGELAALKLEDNIESCILFIHRTESREIVDGKKQIVIQETSKMDHDGTIIIPKAAQRIIDITRMRTHRDEYLFSDNGRRITAQSFRRHLKAACKEIGIDYRPPHQMRKTYASILLASGTDEAIIQREMRHTDISTTRTYYQYITSDEEEEKEVIDQIAGL